MVWTGPKRRCRRKVEDLDGKKRGKEAETMAKPLHFPILELPQPMLSDILSGLPMESILACRRVCKLFLKIVDDPYFAEVHRRRPPVTVFRVASTSSSTDCHHGNSPTRNHPPRTLKEQSSEFCFFSDNTATLIGECHGMLCLLYIRLEPPVYCVCNPITGEYLSCPYQTSPLLAYQYFDLSGFGYCPKTKEYKLIRFSSVTSVDPITSSALEEMVVEIHTLGSDSWRRVPNAPRPKIEGSFDPYLNGSLHYLTESLKPSELICAVDLEKECIRFMPPPNHFSLNYFSKITWISVGTFEECLCLCYIYDHSDFEAWVMKDYGVKESWTKEFSIHIKFYTGLKEKDLQRPLKFCPDGNLWLHSFSDFLLSYSPKTRTFNILEALGSVKRYLIMYFPTFISPRIVIGDEVKKISRLTM